MIQKALLSSIVIFVWLWAFQQPLHPDEHVFLQQAQLLRNDGVIYRDAFDHKPPGVYFLLWFLGIGGEVGVLKLRLTALALSLFPIYVLWQIRKLQGYRNSIEWTSILLLLLPYYQGNFLLTETLMMPFVLMVYLLLLRMFASYKQELEISRQARNTSMFLSVEAKRNYYLVCIGICSGLALLSKQSAIVTLCATVLLLTFRWKSIASLCMYLVGVFLSWLPTFLYFYQHQLWVEAWHAIVSFNIHNYPSTLSITTVGQWIPLVLPISVLFAVYKFGAQSPEFKNRNKWFRTYMYLQLILLLPFLFHRPYHHYWLQVLYVVTLM